ncbi:unnamed protein product [Tetraodon nigroviridis]|uniref:(spotted green pufferfish) hypothetical protein n=1 Tax=Tetraodon nigroviridis TaxID=99883 RepID=Q4RM16_TETNG|nr:unnamed protein product [Tetraodon nigroviridis]
MKNLSCWNPGFVQLTVLKTPAYGWPIYHLILNRLPVSGRTKLDLSQPLEEQGQLDVIIHKLTDLILEADQNDSQAMLLVQRVQDYIDAHPETIILDPLPAIRTLLDRCKSYQLIHRLESCMKDERICSPPFMVLNADCSPDVLEQIRRQGLTFPFICKTRVAHGTNSHEVRGLPHTLRRCPCSNSLTHQSQDRRLTRAQTGQIKCPALCVFARPLRSAPVRAAGWFSFLHLDELTTDEGVLLSPDGHHLQRGGPAGHQTSLRDPELHQPQRGALQGVCGGRLLHGGGETFAEELPVRARRPESHFLQQPQRVQAGVLVPPDHGSRPSQGERGGRVSAPQRRRDQEAVQVAEAGAGRVPVRHRRHHQQPDGPTRGDRHQRLPRWVQRPRSPRRYRRDPALINAFVSSVLPGYEGVPQFFSDLLSHITAVLQTHSAELGGEQPKGLPLSSAPGAGPWIVDGEGGLKGSRQRLACNSAVSPNFQQHCVSTIPTKASSH